MDDLIRVSLVEFEPGTRDQSSEPLSFVRIEFRECLRRCAYDGDGAAIGQTSGEVRLPRGGAKHFVTRCGSTVVARGFADDGGIGCSKFVGSSSCRVGRRALVSASGRALPAIAAAFPGTVVNNRLDRAALDHAAEIGGYAGVFLPSPDHSFFEQGTQRQKLAAVFPDAVIADYRETHPLITRGLNNATTFLSLVSLIALVVGALGVAMAMQSHLQQKMDAIAVMKSLGGRSSQILQIYLLQALLLALAGGAIGLLLGAGDIQRRQGLLEKWRLLEKTENCKIHRAHRKRKVKTRTTQPVLPS